MDRKAEYPARPEDCFIGTFHDEDKEQPWYDFEELKAIEVWKETQQASLLRYFTSETPRPDKWGCPIPTDEEQCQQGTTAYYDPKSPYNDFKPGISYYLDKATKGTTYWIDMSALAPKGDARMSDLTMASAMGLVLVKSRQYGRSRQKGGDKI